MMARLRFTLRTFFLLLFIGSLIASHLYTSWQLHAQRQENAAMRKELGWLTINDHEKVNIISVPTHEDKQWRWRVYVPKGRVLRLLSATHSVPLHGWPSEYGSAFLPAGESPVTAAIRRSANGEWQLRIALGGLTICLPITDRHCQWLVDDLAWETTQAGTNGTESFSPGDEIVLLRLRPMKKPLRGTSSTSRPEPSQGLMIWISSML